jgi:hypothetical protein
MKDEDERITIAAEASVAASVETADAIAEAVELNEDPQVAEALEHATLAADTSVVRVSWLARSWAKLRSSLRRRGQEPG